MKKREQEGMDGYDWYEGQPKWPLRRIIGTAVAAVSLFIYVFLFFRFCTAFSGGFGDVILLRGQSASLYPSETASVRRFYPETREEDDGTVQVQYVVALEEANHFQLTLKIRRKAHPPVGGEPGYRVVLRQDLDGEIRFFDLTDCEQKDAFGYRYLVCLFDGVSRAADGALTLFVYPGDAAGDASSLADSFYTAPVGGAGVYSAEVHPKESVFIKQEP